VLVGQNNNNISLITWDITVVSTLAHSYLHASGQGAAGAAKLAVSRKEAKYYLPRSFLFVPIALETLGAVAPCSPDFLTEVCRRLSAATGKVSNHLLSIRISS